MKLNYIKCVCFLLGSLLPNVSHSYLLSWYGILRGESSITYKSPVNGIIEYLDCIPGSDKNDVKIFKVASIDSASKKDILELKLYRARDEYKKYKDDYEKANSAYNEGLIAKNELRDIESELISLNYINELSNPYVQGRFVCQEVFVSPGSYIASGDLIMNIEMINKYRIEIKFDPVTTNLKKKSIRYRSLVNGSTGWAKVISTKNITNNSSMEGLKSAVLELEDNGKLSPELLDTAFEITLHD